MNLAKMQPFCETELAMQPDLGLPMLSERQNMTNTYLAGEIMWSLPTCF